MLYTIGYITNDSILMHKVIFGIFFWAVSIAFSSFFSWSSLLFRDFFLGAYFPLIKSRIDKSTNSYLKNMFSSKNWCFIYLQNQYYFPPPHSRHNFAETGEIYVTITLYYITFKTFTYL